VSAIDEVEVSREAEAPDGDRSQLLRVQLPLDENPDRNATPSPRFTASLMAVLLPSSSATFNSAKDRPARSRLCSKGQWEPEPDSRTMSGSWARASSETVRRVAHG
jgi:hypothetical protein